MTQKMKEKLTRLKEKCKKICQGESEKLTVEIIHRIINSELNREEKLDLAGRIINSTIDGFKIKRIGEEVC